MKKIVITLTSFVGMFLIVGNVFAETVSQEQVPEVSIDPNQVISSPLVVSGNSLGVWFGFEGQLGTMDVVTEDGEVLATAPLLIEGEWMTEEPVGFGAAVNFDAGDAKQGKLVFKNNNPSDKRELDKSFEVPVKFVEDESETESEKGFWDKIVAFFQGLFN